MKARSLFSTIPAVLLFVPLAGLAFLGSFTRFYADDFCMAGDAVQLGLAGMLAKWYAHWTGRYSFILGTGVFGLGGPGFAGWVPVIAGAVWLAGLSWAVLPLVRRAGWPRPRLMAILAAELALLVVLSTTPNLFQSFFWQNGMVNYSMPLIGMTFMGGILLRAWLEKIALLPGVIGVLLLAFLAGGFSEVYSAMQVALYLLAIILALVLGGRSLRGPLLLILGAALAGGLLAMAVILIAPGNALRQETTGIASPGLIRIVTFSIRNAAYIVGHFIIWNPGWAALSAAVPFLTAWLASREQPTSSPVLSLRALWSQTWLRAAVVLLLAGFGLAAAACAPVVYALNAYPDDRSIIVPQFVIVITTITVSALLGAGLRKSRVLPDLFKSVTLGRGLMLALAAILLLGAGISTWQSVSQIPSYQAYTQAWDQRARIIQQAAVSSSAQVTVTGLPARYGVGDLNADPANWVNQCMAGYYHLSQLQGR